MSREIDPRDCQDGWADVEQSEIDRPGTPRRVRRPNEYFGLMGDQPDISERPQVLFWILTAVRCLTPRDLAVAPPPWEAPPPSESQTSSSSSS